MNRNESSGTQVENGFDCAPASAGVGVDDDDGEGKGASERDGEGEGERGKVEDKGDGVEHPPLGFSGIELLLSAYPKTK
jgi:hypothetical protein